MMSMNSLSPSQPRRSLRSDELELALGFGCRHALLLALAISSGMSEYSLRTVM